ncbi:putative spermidine/putrescine transport system permease protein [Roseovarius litoreus]|uniref:Putative spermidine/putrescine transport system permease protein n=1 Tax=Roseovarius litoreus TaxID=1155722 RepID=A0A1M7LMG9_9RHOB|nr:ABC transporter permease [Roseovarius litoreus]SHM79249.1 putative spermidine/putrescine transport system permease protein [Roseovarius litoreus]
MRIGFWGAILLLAAPLAFMLAFFAAPFVAIAFNSLQDPDGGLSMSNYVRLVTDPYYLKAMGTTLSIAGWVTLITLLLGYPLAYFMVFRVRKRWLKRILYILVVTPLFTSNVVRAFSWIILLGRNGFVNDLLIWLHLTDKPLPLLFNKVSIIIGLAYIMLPFMILSVAAILQNLDHRLKDAARDLGAGPWSTFFHVTLPLSLPGIVSGALMVFTLCVSAYVTPSILSGGREVVMSMLVFQQYATVLNFSFGATLAVALLITAFLLLAVYHSARFAFAKARQMRGNHAA